MTALAPDILDEVARLERNAVRHATPCGAGELVWHEWGAGPPLILMHGGFGSWLHWSRNIVDLARDFRVLAVDLPGLGASDAAPEPHTAPGLAAIIAAGIDRLIGEDGRFFVAAFSLGAVISAPMIAAMGGRVRHGVLIGAGGLGEMWQNAVAGQRRRSKTMTEAEQREVIRENLGRSMIGDPARIDDATVTIQFRLLAQKRALRGLPMSQSSVVLDNLPAIRDRVTLLWGEHDPYLCPDLESAVVKLRHDIPGLDVRIVPDAGHWTNYEQPGAIAAILREVMA